MLQPRPRQRRLSGGAVSRADILTKALEQRAVEQQNPARLRERSGWTGEAESARIVGAEPVTTDNTQRCRGKRAGLLDAGV